jgi:hypothetical protein
VNAGAIIAVALIGLVPVAHADPAIDHVVDAPTAWLPHAGAVIGSASLDRFLDGAIALGYGMGGVAAVELGIDSTIHVCTTTSCARAVYQGQAAFRIGAVQDRWFAGQPALVFGVQTTFATSSRVATAYLVASRVLGPLRLHAGVAALDAEYEGVRMATAVRPLAGIELVPPQFPQSTMLADVEWVPQLPLAGAPTATWLIGGGVRYQALTWGSIELVVRAREGAGLGNSDVLVRVNGVWGN